MDMFFLLIVLQMLSFYEAYEFTCPSQVHWNIRAKSMCDPPRKYTCLFNVTFRVNVYRDICNRPRILGQGYKYVFQPNLNRATCSVDRYQPFIFDTNGYSDCTYQKSLCNSLGQETYANGNTTVDRKCICDTDRGYIFVKNSENQCYCNPSTEDCSCYLGINATIGLKDIKCYDDFKMTRSPYLGDIFNISQSVKIIEFDNFKYNLYYHTNGYRTIAAILILPLLLAYFAFCIVIVHEGIQFCSTPRQFDVVDCTDRSITITWYINDQDGCLDYELDYRVQGTQKWTVKTFSAKDVWAEENGRRMYKLLNILPEKVYELKLCSVENYVKSHYSESKTQQTLKLVLPEVKNQLSEEDKIRYNKLMQSEQTENRYFVRIMIVGKESAGKTCLLRRLLKEDIYDVTSTDGVDIVVRRCKINIEDGNWTIDTDIDDDKVDRIKRALTPNEKTKITTKGYKEKDLAELGKIQKTGSNAQDKMSEIKNNASPVEFTHDVTGDKKDTPEMNVDVTNEDNITYREELSDREKFYENIDNGPSLLVMPEDLMAHVLTNSATNTSLNHFAMCELWDFAGQKEFYATHQAFLTSNAVYLVVADINDDISKKGISQCFADFQDVGEYVDFWFDSIHCHRTVDSLLSEHFDPPILLVFTGKDKFDKAQFTKRKEELDKQIDDVLGHRSKYHHLHEKFYLSNTNDPDEEFLMLRNAIFKTAGNMDSWGESFPLKWILLEQLIEINKESGKKFINFTDMVNMGKHPDINILKEKDLLIFLRFQHNLGNIIFYENIPELIILKPQWLADAFRCLVSDRVDTRLHHLEDWTLLKQHGKLNKSLITKLFDSKYGSKNQFSGQKGNLIKIMEKLDILVKIDNSPYYIMPSKMPSSKLEAVYKYAGIIKKDCKRTSWLCLKFDFLPPSFFNHLSAWFIRNYNPSKVDSDNGSFILYRGICMFDIDITGCVKILVTMSTDTIALQVVSFSKQQREVSNTCSHIHNKVTQVVEDIKKNYRVRLSFKLHFKCSDGDYYKDTFVYETLASDKECFCPQHMKAHRSEKIYSPWMKNQFMCGSLGIMNIPATFKERQAKLGSIVLRVLPKVMQTILKEFISPRGLQLKYQLQDLRTTLTLNEISLMEKLPNIDEFTIQLCYNILRNETLIAEPSCKIGNPPNNTDVEIADDIQRIVIATNEVIGKKSEDVSEIYYEGFLKRQNEILKRVDTYLHQDTCLNLKTILRSEINSTDILQELALLQQVDMRLIVDENSENLERNSRMSLVIIELFPNIFRDIIRSIISPSKLYQMCIPKLLNFYTEQQTCLHELQSSNSYDSFDISLIYKLLRLFSLVPKPTKGWGSVPDKEDTTLSDDVERIRYYRNQLPHRCRIALTKEEFDHFFNQFCDIGHRVDLHFFQKTNFEYKINMCKTCLIDIQMKTKYSNALKELEKLRLQFEKLPIKYFWGESFDRSLTNLKQMLEPEKSAGRRRKVNVQIIFQKEEDMEKEIDILNSLKHEINEDLGEIEFSFATKG